MNTPSIDELIEKLVSLGDFWDFQHEEIFFKNDLSSEEVITKQREDEQRFQAYLMEMFVMARKIKRSKENA